MIIKFSKGTSAKEVNKLCDIISSNKISPFKVELSGIKYLILSEEVDEEIRKLVASSSFVSQTIDVVGPANLTDRLLRPEGTEIVVGKHKIGGGAFTVIAGPCSIESEKQLLDIAQFLASHKTDILRAGAYKPRTSPYTFQGIGEEGLEILSSVSRETGLPVVTELMDVRDAELVARYTDIVQIGARNCQNYSLLKEVGKIGKPILLKRGAGCSIKELLLSAEYIMLNGNDKIILCERGIKTFENKSRNTLDIAAVPVLKKESHLPVIVDPSHATGDRSLVPALALAAMAAGADGLMVEVHYSPEAALSDGAQTLNYEEYRALNIRLRILEKALNKD